MAFGGRKNSKMIGEGDEDMLRMETMPNYEKIKGTKRELRK